MMAQPGTLSCEEFLDLAAGVALDAATAEDERLVAQHARECPDCARALEDFRAVAAGMGAAVPQVEPPAALKPRVLEAASATRVREVPPRTPGVAGLRVPAVPRFRRRGWSPAWLVAAASFLFSIGALLWAAQLQGQITAIQTDAQAARDRASRYDHLVEVLASDKLAIRPLQPAVQTMPSRGMIYLDPASGTGVVTCQNLPPIEQGRAYQVWFVRGNERVSGGLLWPDRAGNAETLIVVPPDVQSFDSVGLTDEPGTGSAWPTTPRVMGSPLKENQN